MFKKDAEVKNFKVKSNKTAEIEAPERYTIDDLVEDSVTNEEVTVTNEETEESGV